MLFLSDTQKYFSVQILNVIQFDHVTISQHFSKHICLQSIVALNCEGSSLGSTRDTSEASEVTPLDSEENEELEIEAV